MITMQDIKIDTATGVITIRGEELKDDWYVKEKYDQYCTAEFIAEMFGTTPDKVWDIAGRVRYEMSRCDYSEEVAIEEVLNEVYFERGMYGNYETGKTLHNVI